MRRIPPSQQLAQLAEHRCRETDVEDLTSELVRLGARKLIQELLEAEVTETLGRAPYERREAGADGYRNGYKRRRLDRAEGRVPVDVPQVRQAAEPFRSTLWPALKTRTEVVEQLAVEMYVRGLSTRDIEDALARLVRKPGARSHDYATRRRSRREDGSADSGWSAGTGYRRGPTGRAIPHTRPGSRPWPSRPCR